jgi:hypothetical protein
LDVLGARWVCFRECRAYQPFEALLRRNARHEQIARVPDDRVHSARVVREPDDPVLQLGFGVHLTLNVSEKALAMRRKDLLLSSNLGIAVAVRDHRQSIEALRCGLQLRRHGLIDPSPIPT